MVHDSPPLNHSHPLKEGCSAPDGRVLFICRGNLCRSPMAMALLRHKLAAGDSGIRMEVDSAGYHDWGTFLREAHPFARRAVQELCGTDLLAEHVARRWNPDMVLPPTLVVVAEEWMRADFPVERVMTLRELAGESGDVADPYGSDYPTYVECARAIERLLDAGMAALVGRPARDRRRRM